MPSDKNDRSDLRLGWHFLSANKKLGYGDNRVAEVGKTLSCTGTAKPRCCYYGMHASPQIAQAASFNKGPVLTRVEVWGDVHTDGDKFAGRHRKVLWMRTLAAADIRACLKAAGVPKNVNAMRINSLINELGYAAGNSNYRDKIEEWFKGWTRKNGYVDGIDTAKGKLMHAKPEIDVKTLRSLLNDRFVKSESDLKREVGDVFDMSTWDDALYYLRYEDDVIEISPYCQKGNRDWESGYVLKRKYKRPGGKRKK